jgi:hypothetical protein
MSIQRQKNVAQLMNDRKLSLKRVWNVADI